MVLISTIQLCPAPPAVIGGVIGAAGAIVGGVGGGLGGAAIIKNGKDKRATAPSQEFISRYPVAWNACQEQLGRTTVTVTLSPPGGARFDGVPPACMTLAGVYLGENPDPRSAPLVLGTASLQYNYLRPEDLNAITQALDANKSSSSSRRRNRS